MAAFEGMLPHHAWGSRYIGLQTPNLIGTDVKVFQTLFNLFQRYSDPPTGAMGAPITADGIFTLEAGHAVRAWQSYFGLSDDGIIGPAMGATLGQLTDAYGGPPFGSRLISTPRLSGGDIIVLGNRLACYRYVTVAGHAGRARMDAATRAAVMQLQQDMNAQGSDMGVPVDGLVRFATFDALWAYTCVGGRNLRQGRHGIDTLWLQRFLRSLGFYDGRADGYFTSVVASGVKAFQTSRRIAADGQVGPRTMYHVGQVFNKSAGLWP